MRHMGACAGSIRQGVKRPLSIAAAMREKANLPAVAKAGKVTPESVLAEIRNREVEIESAKEALSASVRLVPRKGLEPDDSFVGELPFEWRVAA